MIVEQTLREHVESLETRINRLIERAKTATGEERVRLDAEIRAVSLALGYYRNAIEIEESLPKRDD